MRTRPIPAHGGAGNDTNRRAATRDADDINHTDNQDGVTACERADTHLQQDWSRRRRAANHNASTASMRNLGEGVDTDDLARSRREADRAAAAKRPTSGPPAPHR